MNNQERPVSKEVLERIEKDEESCGDAGNKVLNVTIKYQKAIYRTRPRGYYLHLRVYLETDRGYEVHCLSFGDEGDPSSQFLLQETKAFSQKAFDALDVDAELLATRIAQIKAEYIRRRDLKKARYAKSHDAEEDSVDRGEMAGLMAGASIV